jgi:hypothetical protein
LTQRAKEIACIIYDIEKPCRAKAEEYLLRQMRNRGVLEEACIDEVREELNSEYHGASHEERARWRNPLTPAAERRRKEALQFLSEFSLHGWVRHSNEALGKAPTSAQMATKYNDLVQGVAHCDQKKTWKPTVAMSSKTRSFLKRWRRRWAVKFRRLPLGTTITEEETKKKMFNEPSFLIWNFCTDTRNNSPTFFCFMFKNFSWDYFFSESDQIWVHFLAPNRRQNLTRKRARQEARPFAPTQNRFTV